MKERIVFIDALRGLAILLVVLGHVPGYIFENFDVNARASENILWCVIYSFHMPLFFFLSGYVGLKKGIDVGKTILNRTLSYLLPYIVLFVFVGEYWFLLSLWEFSMVGILVMYISEKVNMSSRAEIALILFFCLLSVLIPKLSFTNEFIKLLTHNMEQMPSFFLGYIVNKREKVKDLVRSRLSYTLFGVLWLVLVYAFFRAIDIPLPASGTIMYHSTWLCGVLFFYNMFSNYFNTSSYVTDKLCYFGKISLVIYIFHFFYIPHLHDLGNYLLKFDMQSLLVLELFCMLIISFCSIFLCHLTYIVLSKSRLFSLLLLGKGYKSW
ncbi:MAG: acyltransferase [Paludibacteraceae bacterium]|nr:acyltransferase [Paludibacteraceae bacterium]